MRMVTALLLIVCHPALAEETGAQSFADLYPALPGVEYFCTDANGTRFELGQVICVTASCQSWMARCDMSQNNTTWRKVSDGCPVSSVMDRLRQVARL